jgi:hypothetical protein
MLRNSGKPSGETTPTLSLSCGKKSRSYVAFTAKGGTEATISPRQNRASQNLRALRPRGVAVGDSQGWPTRAKASASALLSTLSHGILPCVFRNRHASRHHNRFDRKWGGGALRSKPPLCLIHSRSQLFHDPEPTSAEQNFGGGWNSARDATTMRLRANGESQRGSALVEAGIAVTALARRANNAISRKLARELSQCIDRIIER